MLGREAMKTYIPQRVRLPAIADSIPIGLKCIYNARALGAADRYPFLCNIDHMGRPSNKIYVDVAELVQWGLARGIIIRLPQFIEIQEKVSAA